MREIPITMQSSVLRNTYNKKSQVFFWSSLGFFVLIVLKVLATRQELSFPYIPTGTYVGYITGLANFNRDSASLLVESFGDGEELHVNVLLEGVSVQKVTLKERNVSRDFLPLIDRSDVDKAERKLGATHQYNPISLSLGDVSYLLFGERHRSDWSGGHIASDGGGGHWFLERTAEEPRSIPDEAKDAFGEWLYYRTFSLLAEEQVSSLARQVNLLQSRYKELQVWSASPGDLQKAVERKNGEVGSALGELVSGNTKLSTEVQAYVKELELLMRLTKRGNVVMLARRIYNREKSWQLAGWDRETMVDGGDEGGGAGEDGEVNLAELNDAYLRANENAKLFKELDRERRALERLRRELLESRGSRVVIPKPEPIPQPEEERSLWDRIFN